MQLSDGQRGETRGTETVLGVFPLVVLNAARKEVHLDLPPDIRALDRVPTLGLLPSGIFVTNTIA